MKNVEMQNDIRKNHAENKHSLMHLPCIETNFISSQHSIYYVHFKSALQRKDKKMEHVNHKNSIYKLL